MPKSVKDNLPAGAQTIFRKAFNSAYHTYGKQEVRAFMIAWAAVKKVYRKDKKTGKWVKKK